jgi:hypothetical protein
LDQQFDPGVASAISAELRELHSRLDLSAAYGPSRVALHSGFLAIVREVRLTPAEAALLGAGRREPVRERYEELAQALAERYCSIVEAATGRSVDSVSSSVSLSGARAWSADVFLLAAAD